MLLWSVTVSADATNQNPIEGVKSADAAASPVTVAPHPSDAVMEALGRRMFFDPSLSASHRMSCATCHDPAYAFGPPTAHSVQLGGTDQRRQGVRATPSLRYLQNVPTFTEHFYDENEDEGIDAGPAGGHTWDGRVDTLHEQARLPLLSPIEMANGSAAEVVTSVQRSDYADDFRRAFGDRIFRDSEAAFTAITMALETFQRSPTDFYPYTSKYDAFLRGETKLSVQEQHGLDLFNDPRKGNCAQCHPSTINRRGFVPNFSDFDYIALGVPRNRQLAVNRDPHYYDLGLCGPLRTDLQTAQQPEFCGRFRTPSLRNVALRRAFFHNGVFHSLKRVLEFYVERDIHPEKFYPRDVRGHVHSYDDLPAAYRQNANKEPPFDRGPKDKPALSPSEIDDVIAFLKTLTDGWNGPK